MTESSKSEKYLRRETSLEDQSKIVIFYLTDPALVELDWILPVMKEFASSSYQIVVLFLEPPREDMQQFLLKLVSIIAHKTLSLDNFEPLPLFILKFLRRIRKCNNIFSRLTSLYFSTGRLGKLMGTLKWRRGCIYSALDDWLSRERVFAFIHTYKKKTIPTDSGWLPWYWVVDAVQRKKVPVVGCPAAVAVTVAQEDYMMPHDLTIVTREEQANFLNAKRPEPIIAIGTPQFESSWVRYLQQSYEAFISIEKFLPRDRKLALVVLKNDTSIVWEGIDFVKTTKSLLQQLSNQNYFLILKPHPRQTMMALHAVLTDFSTNDYLIDYGPLTYWAIRADISVSLFSGGALHPLALGKVPYVYWPIDEAYKETIKAGKAVPLYVSREKDGSYKTQYDDFAIVIKESKLRLEEVITKPFLERFERTFRPKGSAQRFREACEKFLLKQSSQYSISN